MSNTGMRRAISKASEIENYRFMVVVLYERIRFEEDYISFETNRRRKFLDEPSIKPLLKKRLADIPRKKLDDIINRGNTFVVNYMRSLMFLSQEGTVLIASAYKPIDDSMLDITLDVFLLSVLDMIENHYLDEI
jgi:hypothetical protein